MTQLRADYLEQDIYYQREYAELYTGESELFEFVHEEAENQVFFRGLKRRINEVAGIAIEGEALYDLETPYGYGGPLSNSYEPAFLQRAFAAYREHCQSQNIVCEFMRFHPFNTLCTQDKLFDMHFEERRVVVVDLTLSQEERRAQYSKTTRNIVKRATKRLTAGPINDNFSAFKDMYYQTMTKNQATEFFYFEEPYFEQLSSIPGVILMGAKLEEEFVSTGYFMCSGELAHYHLSANNNQLNKEHGNYLLLDAAFDYAKLYGCKYMMLGGGRTSSVDDSLFKFKSKFSPLNLPFYIAGLDFLPQKRKELNAIWVKKNQVVSPPKLFQLYRV